MRRCHPLRLAGLRICEVKLRNILGHPFQGPLSMNQSQPDATACPLYNALNILTQVNIQEIV